jgi:hypothetical protein
MILSPGTRSEAKPRDWATKAPRVLARVTPGRRGARPAPEGYKQ